MNIEEGECLGFRSILIDNGRVQLEVLPEIGGRVMSFGFPGQNILFVNPQMRNVRASYEALSPALIQAEREKQGLMLYGGEKIWLAPQDDWGQAPYVDLDHGVYNDHVTQGSDQIEVVLESPICRETGLQITKTITILEEQASVHFSLRLSNHGTSLVHKGIWQVTQLNRPAEVRIAANDANELYYSSYYGNAFVHTEPGGLCNRVNHGERYKVGVHSDKGEVTIQMAGIQFHQHFPVYKELYPHAFMFEVFNSDKHPYFEAEIHSPLMSIEPQSSATFEISWRLT
ncbi:hypothetical protein J2T13_004156 [Paenibacillus sp. DS2015]|uniref:DUF4380 domain-containing protein n=1 Tax=Paenibacillus sp. DS2015 TaxID=3373917 RepID=UPI003D1CF607